MTGGGRDPAPPLSIDSDDPFAHYARLRADAPVHRFRLGEEGKPERQDVYVVSRYEDVRAILGDHARFSTIPDEDATGPPPGSVGHGHDADNVAGASTWPPDMLGMDPPEHTRLRRLVSRAFSPRHIERMRPRAQAIADTLLDGLEPHGEVDLLAAFARPLCRQVIHELVGVPTDRPRSHGGSGVLQRDDLMDLVDRTRSDVDLDLPDDEQPSLLHLLIAANARGLVGARDLPPMLMLLLIPGEVATVPVIGNAIVALLTHPDQCAKLRARPELLSAAIEEVLRLHGGEVHARERLALEDVEVGGVTIPRGARVSVVIASADRDPRRFPDPDALDIGRTDHGHIAFGRGVHVCLGAQLARIEAHVAVGTLIRRFPELALACPPGAIRWKRYDDDTNMFHELESLPLRLSPRHTGAR